MAELNEMNPAELEEVTGGKTAAGGSPTPLSPKAGYVVYRIAANDTLIRIANKYGTTVNAIMAANPSIKDKRLIRAGYYNYVPSK